MIKQICHKCATNDWVIVLKDDNSRIEFRGCKEHIDELHMKISSVKGLDKLNVDKVLKKLKLELEED